MFFANIFLKTKIFCKTVSACSYWAQVEFFLNKKYKKSCDIVPLIMWSRNTIPLSYLTSCLGLQDLDEEEYHLSILPAV